MVVDMVKNFLSTRRQAYRRVFYGAGDGKPSIPGGRVLEDLAKFCRAHESPFHADDRATLIMIGRQEVWLRIQHQLQLTDEQLWALYAKTPD